VAFASLYAEPQRNWSSHRNRPQVERRTIGNESR
jgi:hypothetical protein